MTDSSPDFLSLLLSSQLIEVLWDPFLIRDIDSSSLFIEFLAFQRLQPDAQKLILSVETSKEKQESFLSLTPEFTCTFPNF